MTDLLALAERCERESPSRDLDAAIAGVCGWSNVEKASDWGRTDFVGDAPEGDSFQCWLPHWTSSLDAAVTLVPKGFQWSASSVGTGTLWEDPPKEIASRLHASVAKTTALAICAASLRARASSRQAA